jgi:hypothetical protein
MTKSRSSLALLLALLLLSVDAYAQGSAANDEEQMVAGLKAFADGDFERAAALLSEDLQSHPWPTVAYYAGQAQEKLGKLVEAAELYRRAAELEAPGTGRDRELEQAAKQKARGQLSELEPRIPRLVLKIDRPSSEGVSVTLDGVQVPASSLGQPLPLNPGGHELVVQCSEGEAATTQAVALEESQNRELALCPEPASAAHVLLPPSGSPQQQPSSRSLLPVAGWIGVGVGGAALLTSGITTALAIDKHGGLKCDAQSYCTPAAETRSYNSLKSWATWTFWLGVPVAAAGAGALWWSGRHEEQAPMREGMTAWVGLGSAGVTGRFQ